MKLKFTPPEIAAMAIAGGAIAGSVTSLYNIAKTAGLDAPWSLPLALDLTAVVAALLVRKNRKDRFGWAILAIATAVSTLLQVAEHGNPIHGIPPLGAVAAFELALRLAPKPKARARAARPKAASRPRSTLVKRSVSVVK
jgi:hypothetical protein